MGGRRCYFRFRAWRTNRYASRLLVLLCLAFLLLFSLKAVGKFRPMLREMAVSRASNTVTRMVSETVNEVIADENTRYSDLISYEKDTSGHITALHSNMAACNRLQSLILDTAAARVEQIPAKELSIPIGNLTGLSLLAGRGPCIHVRMESTGAPVAHFENEFCSAGINQTKHQVILYIDVFITVLLPGIAASAKVSNAVPVAETIIVGTVPQTYTYFSTDPAVCTDGRQDYMLNNS